jgi:hypothetical protein
MKLTQARIERLTLGRNGVGEFVPDAEQPGLYVRVYANGLKVYYAQYQHVGRKIRMRIAEVDAVSLAQARVTARKVMGQAADGKDPASERKEKALAKKRKAARDALTLDTLIDDWAALDLKSNDRRPRYIREATRALRVALKKYLSLPAADLTRELAVRAIDRLTRAGSPVMAAQTTTYGSVCYRWAVRRGALAANPFAEMPRPKTKSRERVLTDAEIKRAV